MKQTTFIAQLLVTGVFVIAAQVHAQTATSPKAAPANAPARKSQSADPLEIKLERRKVVLSGGKETLESAASAKPGDIFEETATYTNKSKGLLSKVEATLPVPPNTELIMGSVKPNAAKASVDGANFAPFPLKRKVKQPNGVEVEQPVPLSEYRYLRWYPGDMAAGAALVFSARFKVSDK
jgi:hypothetical protein